MEVRLLQQQLDGVAIVQIGRTDEAVVDGPEGGRQRGGVYVVAAAEPDAVNGVGLDLGKRALVDEQVRGAQCGAVAGGSGHTEYGALAAQAATANAGDEDVELAHRPATIRPQ